MQKEMQLPEALSERAEHARDMLILGHVALQDHRVGAKRTGELLDIFLHAFPLASEGRPRATAGQARAVSPGDGPVVGHAKDYPELSGEGGCVHRCVGCAVPRPAGAGFTHRSGWASSRGIRPRWQEGSVDGLASLALGEGHRTKASFLIPGQSQQIVNAAAQATPHALL